MQYETNEKSKKVITIAIISAVLGLALSLYTLVHHYKVKELGATDAFCNISETLNCDAVANSAYSEFLTIPLGGYGLGFFAACLYLILAGFTSFRPNFLALWLAKDASQESLQHGFLLFTTIGLVVSVGLGLISHFAVGSLCPTCMGIYALSFVLLICAFWLNIPISKYKMGQGIRGSIYAVIPVLLLLGATLVFSKARTSNVANDTADHDHEKKAAPNTVFNLEISTSPYSRLGEDYRKGSDDAKVTLVEFADFECPACGDLAMSLKQVHEQFGDKVRIVFKNFPLHRDCNPAYPNSGGHQNACNIAIMARCAGQYGKFWQFHDLAFVEQRGLHSQSYIEWAKKVGLTDAQIETCKKSKDIREKIADDGRLGDDVQVEGTPSLYINGRKYEGRRSPSDLAAEIAKYL